MSAFHIRLKDSGGQTPFLLFSPLYMQYITVSDRTHSTNVEARAGKEDNILFELGGELGSKRGNRKRGKSLSSGFSYDTGN